MFCKVTLAVVALIAVAHAGYLGGGGLEHYGGAEIADYAGGHEDHYEHPKYQFQYSVHDPHTGDSKQQYEERDGDQVHGSYTVKEADGTTRVVEYKADKYNGFNAVVSKIGEPQQHHYH